VHEVFNYPKSVGSDLGMSAPKTRKRTIILSHTEGDHGTLGPIPVKIHHTRVLRSTQTTVSEGHPWSRLGHSSEDVGGEFFSERSFYSNNSRKFLIKSQPIGGTTEFYDGYLYPKLSTGSIGPLEGINPCTHSSNSQIDAAGTTAIARTIPTNPVAGMAVTLGELHEGFPKLMGTLLFKRGLKKFLQGSGDEFLNYEFGIKPLINDLLKWAHAYTHADKLWDQFLRDSGKRVRRHYTFPKSSEVISATTIPNQPVWNAGVQNTRLWQGGNYLYPLEEEILLERERWFAGAFTYFVDTSDGQRNNWKLTRRRLDYLYSTKVTPQVIWNLAPWSWAADWIANIGDIITNFTRFSEDGLVMPYGYMMEQSTMKATYRMRNLTPRGYNIPDLTEVLTHKVKYRRKATPYGFGLNEQDFTARQWAIIGALGLSRS
jgi:hypothetical protein